MQVRSDDGTITLVPCKRNVTEIEYRYYGKERKYRCWSNRVSLSFAQTVHEVQGQTLERVILILGRYAGRSVGRISWSLLYVALSRVKKLEHIKFFPCGRSSSNECFMHLTKLRPPSSLGMWTQSYRNHMWDPAILQEKRASSEKMIESKLCLLGRDVVLVQRKELIFGYVKDLGWGSLADLKKGPLQKILNNHMVKKRLWEPTDEVIERPTKRRSKRYANSTSVNRKQTNKRKECTVNLSAEESVGSKSVAARRASRKRRKTSLAHESGFQLTK